MTLSGSPLDYLIVFLGGILVSFTPCVYPLIPISVAYIGAGSSGSKKRGLFLSLAYVTGIAITYSLLGIAAVATGAFFGKASSNPVTFLAVGIIIILFGLSMLDLFVLALPQFIRPAPLKKKNYFSTFVLGLTSGLIVSPCLTPVLGAILAYLSTRKNIIYGATLLFSFAYGMGLVLILAGTFSSFLLSLPKSAKWMSRIKKIFAFALILIGLYFIFTAIRRF